MLENEGGKPENLLAQRILILDLANTALTARWRCSPVKELRAEV